MQSDTLPLKSAQVTFFTRLDLTDKLAVATKLQTALAPLLDGEPLVMPAFPDAPPEIPQIVLRDAVATHQCLVTPARVDLAYVPSTSDNAEIPSHHSIQTILEPAARLLSLIRTDLSSRVTRLGLVTQFQLQLDENAIDFARRHFLAPDAPTGRRALELSFLDRIQLASLTVNRWIRIKTHPNQVSLLALVADLNTLAEEELDLTEAQTAEFFDQSVKYLHTDFPNAVHLA